jgi:amino acid adenylation domain-containing protein
MLNRIYNTFHTLGNCQAFCIDEKYFTYSDLQTKVIAIQDFLLNNYPNEERIGLVTNNDIETYASVLAILFSGKAFVPINAENPPDRNDSVIDQAGLKIILDSKPENSGKIMTINESRILTDSSILNSSSEKIVFCKCSDDDLAYILFTSGSTGLPKGVPLSRHNLFSFVDAFFALGYKIDKNDRFLQMFDMTFDLSLMSYLVPLCVGACVYTIPTGVIKYNGVYSLLEDKNITVALMVPSVLTFLRKYFDEIMLESMRYSLFCGEALYDDVASEWKNCVPNALVQNVYGPTEATIFCLTYDCRETNKEYNGIVCIGKPMQNIEAVIADENNKILGPNEKGELCLTGSQLTKGYWNNPEKNAETFFSYSENGVEKIYYRTGDLCYVDDDGDFMFAGRVDNQVKIQGFRVELNEIEHHAREFTKIAGVAAVASVNENGNTQIFLFLEKFNGDLTALETYLKAKLPVYMIPAETKILNSFPLNVNGKIDRKELKKLI